MHTRGVLLPLLLLVTAAFGLSGGGNTSGHAHLPPDIQASFDKPLYKHSRWGLRVVDLDTGAGLIHLRPAYDCFIGSVRQVCSVGELRNAVGAAPTSVTSIHRQGKIGAGGVRHGALILGASGDLTMGGRTKPDSSSAVSHLDPTAANALGNVRLTAPTPLAGYLTLAQQVAAAGLTPMTGDVVLDDRLWGPFPFRPLVVHDDCVDRLLNPACLGAPASVAWRPVSAALTGASTLWLTAPRTPGICELALALPPCLGPPDCPAALTGPRPTACVPPLTPAFPLIRPFRMVELANDARPVCLEALAAAGVGVASALVAEPPGQRLSPKPAYSDATQGAARGSWPIMPAQPDVPRCFSALPRRAVDGSRS
jgi:D-alanyl-D-alanine carboxypeptidase